MNDCNSILDSILPFLLVISFICGFFFFKKFNAKTEGQHIKKSYQKCIKMCQRKKIKLFCTIKNTFDFYFMTKTVSVFFIYINIL